MKNMVKLPAVLLGLLLLLTGITQKAMAQDEDISLESFYDELSPYGTWIDDPDYGYVWRPDVDQNNFRPYYTNGRWAMTEYGNTWVSDYDWGWAPFHYGRWILNTYHEWIWIPDTVWGPAWVTWRSGGGYYGWAPLGPGVNIDINMGGGGYDIPNDWWVFIPQINIYNDIYPRYSGWNVSIFNRTSFIRYTYRNNRHTYYTGPRSSDIRRVTNRNVTVYNISRTNRPGRTHITNNNINIYNPRGGRGANNRPGTPDRVTPGRGNVQGQRPPQTNGRPGQPDRNTPGRDNGQGQRPPQTNGRPDQPVRTSPGRDNGQGQRPPEASGRPNQPERTTPGRENGQGQRPEMNGRPGQQRGQDRTPQIEQREQQQRQQQQQREGQQREQQQRQQQQQREGQQREQQQRQQQQQREGQQREQQQRQQQQQREGQQREQQQQRQQQQQQQQRESQQREQQQRQQQQQQQRESQQREQQQRQQQQQQQQSRPARSSEVKSNTTETSRGGRGSRGN